MVQGVKTPDLPLGTQLTSFLGNYLDGDVERTARVPLSFLVAQLALSAFRPNASGPLSGRSVYDEAPLGFAYVSEDGDGAGNSLAVLFVKLSDEDGDWGDPIPWQGPRGTSGVWVALSDEITPIFAGGNKVTVRAPEGFTITDIRLTLRTASSVGPVIVDVNANGTSIFSTRISIDANEKTSVTATTPYVLATTDILDDTELTFDIDDAGVGAVGLKICIKTTPLT